MRVAACSCCFLAAPVASRFPTCTASQFVCLLVQVPKEDKLRTIGSQSDPQVKSKSGLYDYAKVSPVSAYCCFSPMLIPIPLDDD
jgi:hypothetical protein